MPRHRAKSSHDYDHSGGGFRHGCDGSRDANNSVSLRAGGVDSLRERPRASNASPIMLAKYAREASDLRVLPTVTSN